MFPVMNSPSLALKLAIFWGVMVLFLSLLPFAPAALAAEGNPPAHLSFTGTYHINLEVVRTSTLMGPTRETKPSFALRDYEIAVLDQGDSLRIIGRYEEAPFSLNAEIVRREENKLEAVLSGLTWLGPLPESIRRLNQFLPGAFKVRLPEPAEVSASIRLTLERPPGIAPALKAAGHGIYRRPYVPGKGEDYNTYSVSVSGYMFKRDLPPFVAAALPRHLGSAGNIPGPDTPFQAATGMLFPPLVAIIAQIVENYYRRKVEESRAAFERLKREDETTAALLIWAEAVPERAAGDVKDAADSAQEGDKGFCEEVEAEEAGGEVDEYEPEEAVKEKEYEPVEVAAERDEHTGKLSRSYGELRTLLLPVDHTGRTAEMAYDPVTGEWYNTETGNVFDMERYEKDVLPSFEKDREFIEEQRRKLETRSTAFDRQMDEMVQTHKLLLRGAEEPSELTPEQLEILREKMNQVIQEKAKEGYFVRNRNVATKILWNFPALGSGLERILGLKGGQCGEYGEWGAEWSKDFVQEVAGKGTIITSIALERNRFMNHRATKIITPSGERFVLDYWEGMIEKKPKIYSEKEWVEHWKKKLGGNPKIVDQSELELSLKKFIQDFGEQKGIELFRRTVKDRDAAEIIIRSYKRDPW